MNYWQKICEILNISEPISGSWIQALVYYLNEENETEFFEPINGSWVQALAIMNGATEPINGSWVQALYQIVLEESQ